MTPKGGKSTDHDHNLIISEGAQDTSACKIPDHSLHAFSSKYPETSPDGRTDRRTDGRTCRKTVTVGRMDQRTHVQVISGFGRMDRWTDRRTDGQPENIMPPAPKGGGIKIGTSSCQHINSIKRLISHYYMHDTRFFPKHVYTGIQTLLFRKEISRHSDVFFPLEEAYQATTYINDWYIQIYVSYRLWIYKSIQVTI